MLLILESMFCDETNQEKRKVLQEVPIVREFCFRKHNQITGLKTKFFIVLQVLRLAARTTSVRTLCVTQTTERAEEPVSERTPFVFQWMECVDISSQNFGDVMVFQMQC